MCNCSGQQVHSRLQADLLKTLGRNRNFMWPTMEDRRSGRAAHCLCSRLASKPACAPGERPPLGFKF